MVTHPKYVAVGSFDTASEAWLYLNALRDHGFTARLVNEHIVAMTWICSNAYGGIQVQILENELGEFAKLDATEKRGTQQSGSVANDETQEDSLNWVWHHKDVALIAFTSLCWLGYFLDWVDRVTVRVICLNCYFGW